jgi:hypothetical protein
MPSEDWIQHCKVAQFLYDWQTGLAGLIALTAALIGLSVTYGLETRKERRDLIAIRASLAIEMRQIIDNVSRTCLMLKRPSVTTTMAPSDLIMLTDFSEPIVYPATADRLGLLGPLAVDVSTLYANVERLTFSARIVASGPKNGQIPPSELAHLVDLFEQTCRAYLPLLNAIPVNDDDAKLRATIEGMGKSA